MLQVSFRKPANNHRAHFANCWEDTLTIENMEILIDIFHGYFSTVDDNVRVQKPDRVSTRARKPSLLVLQMACGAPTTSVKSFGAPRCHRDNSLNILASRTRHSQWLLCANTNRFK